MSDDIPEIRFMDTEEPIAMAAPTTRQVKRIDVPRAFLRQPAAAVAWMLEAQPEEAEYVNWTAVNVAGALLHTGTLTLLELEKGTFISWSMLFTSREPWLNRLARLYGDHIASGQAETTISDLLMSGDADIRVFAQTLVHRVPAQSSGVRR